MSDLFIQLPVTASSSGSGGDSQTDVFTASETGLVPASGGGTRNFLRADRVFANPIANVVDIFDGDGETVEFDLSKSTTTNNSLVYISGIYQSKNNYSISGTTITFSEAPPTGESNVEINSL